MYFAWSILIDMALNNILCIKLLSIFLWRRKIRTLNNKIGQFEGQILSDALYAVKVFCWSLGSKLFKGGIKSRPRVKAAF